MERAGEASLLGAGVLVLFSFSVLACVMFFQLQEGMLVAGFGGMSCCQHVQNDRPPYSCPNHHY